MSEERLQQTLNDLGVPDYVDTTEERLIARLMGFRFRGDRYIIEA